jgi:hypothetical protein
MVIFEPTLACMVGLRTLVSPWWQTLVSCLKTSVSILIRRLMQSRVSPAWETIRGAWHIFLMLANPLHTVTVYEVSRLLSQPCCCGVALRIWAAVQPQVVCSVIGASQRLHHSR